MLENRIAQILGLITGSAGVAALTSVGVLVGRPILLRILPADEAGLFVLLISVVELAYVVANLGQGNVILRVYSRNSQLSYDWLRDLSVSTWLSVPALLATTFVVALVYPFTPALLLFVFLGSLLATTNLTLSRMLNTHRLYVLSTVQLRLPNAILIAPIIYALVVPKDHNIDYFLIAQIACYAIAVGLGTLVMLRRIRRGEKTLTTDQRKQGGVFMVLQGTTMASSTGIISLIGPLLTLEAIAAFGALEVLLRPVTLLKDVVYRIQVTEYAQQPLRSLRKVLLIALIVGGIGTFTLGIAAHFLSDIIYNGQYNNFRYLIPLMAVANLFALLLTIPQAVIIGSSSNRDLRQFAWATLVVTLLLFLTMYMIVGQFGVIGVPIYQIAYGAIMIAIGLLIIWLDRRARTENSDL